MVNCFPLAVSMAFNSEIRQENCYLTHSQEKERGYTYFRQTSINEAKDPNISICSQDNRASANDPFFSCIVCACVKERIVVIGSKIPTTVDLEGRMEFEIALPMSIRQLLYIRIFSLIL